MFRAMEIVGNHTQQKPGYKPWVDVCKGALLYLVVIGHLWYSATPAVINTIIYSFHMPAFFILSGYVLNTERKSKSMFIKQKMVSLLIPAYICIIATLPIYIKSHGVSIDLLKKLFYVDGRVPYNDPCWFFITLFMVMCVVCFVNLSARTTCVKTLMGGGVLC